MRQTVGWATQTVDQPIKHALGIGTPVDVIPEKKRELRSMGELGHICINPRENLVQEV